MLTSSTGRYPQIQQHGVSNIPNAQRYRNEPSSGATVYANRQVYQRQQIQNYEALQRQEYFRAVASLPGTSDQLGQKRSREPLERQEDHELLQEPPMKKQHYDITFDSDSEDEDITPPNTIQISLSAEQQAVIKLARGGCNIFLTGAAGCGKTVTLTKLLDTLKAEKKKFRVISPTAIAALPLKGTTMHSFFGWGLDPFEKTSHERVASFSPSTRKRIETVQVFIIEEISMLSSLLLDKINEDLREIMANDCPFGGKQVIFTGDFNQLPVRDPKPHQRLRIHTNTSTNISLSCRSKPVLNVTAASLTHCLARDLSTAQTLFAVQSTTTKTNGHSRQGSGTISNYETFDLTLSTAKRIPSFRPY